MNKMKTMASVVALVIGMAAVAPAQAVVTFNFAAGSSVAPSATIIQNFNSTPTPAQLSGTNYILHPGSPNDGTGAAPNASNTQYLAVLAGGSATYTFGAAYSGIQFDWGTASSDNVLTIFTTGASNGFTFTVPNSNVPDGPNYNKNGLATLIASGEQITGLRFASGQNSFEADNIAAVPEPLTWAMMVGGFGLMGASMRRRRVSTTFA